MPTTSKELFAAALAGVVVTGILTALLEAGGLTPPISDGVGAFVGGGVAAYVLYGKVGQAATAGALSGLLGTPFYLGVSEILFIYGVIPAPSGPTPPMSELEVAVVIIFAIDLLFGAFGGVLVAGVRHRHEEPVPPPQITPGTVSQVKYCIQCGAQLPSGAIVCPHCNARQP